VHVVRNLELQVHEADIAGREHVRVVLAVALRAALCAGTPDGGRVGGKPHSAA